MTDSGSQKLSKVSKAKRHLEDMENDIIELVGLKEALKLLFNFQKAAAGITVGPVQFRGELLTQVLEETL